MSKTNSIAAPRGINRIGQKFGRLKVISHAGNSKHGENIWRCKCRCGNFADVLSSSLRKKKTRSCGCFMREEASKRAYRHGHNRTRDGNMARSPTYRSWAMMIQRCINKNLKGYSDYGGRGIKVCDRWKESFTNFLADMGPRPSPEHSIDRIDNDGHYEPGNCRWATDHQQRRNKRTTRLLTLDGKTQCIADWTRDIVVAAGTISQRLSRGWSVERALSTPTNGRLRIR